MVEALVSGVLEQLISVTGEGIQQEVKLLIDINNEVENLSSNLNAIKAVLVDAEEGQVKDQIVRLWLDRLKQASYNIEDVLDEWNYAIKKKTVKGVEDASVPKKKVSFFLRSSCFSFKQVILRRNIAIKIKEVNKILEAITKQKEMYSSNAITRVEKPKHVPTTSFVDVSKICGQDVCKSILIDKLCASNEQNLHIISLIGMGGIEKTTLDQFVYNHDKVSNSFDNKIWICVSKSFDEYNIAKAILVALGDSTLNLNELQSLYEHISKTIQGKKFFLVLDDVWTEDYKKWEPLYCCLNNDVRGSKLLITTRKESVAKNMSSIDIINVPGMSDDDCWLLFKRITFLNRPLEECGRLEEIGKKISSKCKGSPLVAETLGKLLHNKKSWKEWKYILDSELWKLKEIEEDVFQSLLQSYNDLPSMIKRCFVYCAIFPKDYGINKDELIKLWMAQGYVKKEENKTMEIVGEEHFDYLVSRSLFQEFRKDDNVIKYKMHNLVHDFAQFLSKNECLHIQVVGPKEPTINSSNLEKVCHVMVTIYNKDLFPYSIFRLRRMRSLLYDIQDPRATLPCNIWPKLFGELTCLRALNIKLIGDIPKEIGKLIHLRYLDLRGLGIRKLSEALCELYNLQTLNISYCFQLEELPQGMEKLINLRHLQNDWTKSLRYIPKGIQRLSNLQTLNHFVVSCDNDEKACSLQGLKNLNLSGELCIDKLGNALVADESNTSPLKNHESLFGLDLVFSKDGDERERKRTNKEDEALLKILQPSLYLEKLHLTSYSGNTILPNWMMSLTNLRHLTLNSCYNCKHLPPLGELPSLESLYINNMDSLKNVSNEILREETNGTSSSFVFFPKLKRIQFVEMFEWEEWGYEITRIGEEKIITIMPSLVFLEISDCPKLKALPRHLDQNTRLKKRISSCPLLG